jgi:hypothetical protein
MPRMRQEPRIPSQLGIVVSVNVDKAGRDKASLGIDGLSSFREIGAYVGDALPNDANISQAWGAAGAVDDSAPSDQQVKNRHVQDRLQLPDATLVI